MRSIKLIVALFLISIAVNAQPTPGPGPSFKDRLVIGGSLGAQFGTNTQVNISPIIGYRVTDKLTAGIGLNYIYYKYQYFTGIGTNTITESDHIFGASLYGQYRVIPQAFIHIEPGFLNQSIPASDASGFYSGATVRYTLYTFLVGGGYYQQLGANSGMQFSLLWDLIEDQYSPYSNPIIRIGFVTGF